MNAARLPVAAALFRRLGEQGQATALAFAPRRWLERAVARELQDCLANGSFIVRFFRSGRSALSAVLVELAQEHPGGTVLVPAYICNVVPEAVRFAGLVPEAVPVSETLLPDLQFIERKVVDAKTVAVIFASIFGAVACSAESLARIRARRPDLLVILDECQNLICPSPAEVDARCAVVVSFNQKNVLGAMGGAVLVRGDGVSLRMVRGRWMHRLEDELRMWGVHINQVRRTLRDLMRVLRGRSRLTAAPRLEYSRCRKHYGLDPRPIRRISLARALVGIRRLGQVEEARRANAEVILGLLTRAGATPVPTVERGRSPFIPFRMKGGRLPELPGLQIKGPYACDASATTSLCQDLFCVVNDGIGAMATRR